MSRRARVLIWASLALNLFLAGLLASSLILDARARAEREQRRAARSLWAVSEQFDPARRDAFRALLREEAQEARPQVRALRQARREASAVIAREPFDPAAASAALDRARVQELALRRDLDQAIIGYAVQLSPEERALLAEAMRRRGGPWKRDGAGRGPERGERPRER